MIVFGSINLDLLLAVEALPKPGQTLLAQASRTAPGGKGANQAVAAARDGASVRMIGAVGRDAFAAPALHLLTASGVDISGVRHAAGMTTGLASICIDREGGNHIVVAPGANRTVRAAWLDTAMLRPGTVLMTQMEVPPEETAAAIHLARQAGAIVVLNLAPAAPLPETALRAAHVLVVNEDEAAWLGAQFGLDGSAAALHAALGSAVIQTCGAQGAIVADAAGITALPAFPVHAVDSTGAGDCFAGVLAAGLERGETLRDAARRAIVASALSCTRSGAQEAAPDHAETSRAMASRAR